jgi:hypothetical protein
MTKAKPINKLIWVSVRPRSRLIGTTSNGRMPRSRHRLPRALHSFHLTALAYPRMLRLRRPAARPSQKQK